MAGLFSTSPATQYGHLFGTAAPAAPAPVAPAAAPVAAPSADLTSTLSLSAGTPAVTVADAQSQLASLRIEIKGLIAQIQEATIALNNATAAATATPAAAPVATTASPVFAQASMSTDLQNVLNWVHTQWSHLFGSTTPTQPTQPSTPSQPSTPAQPPAVPNGKTTFRISSFNVLGSSHTKASGNKPGMASGPERMKGAVALLKKHNVDIVGLQEFQRDQYDTFKKLAGNTYDVFTGKIGKKMNTENSIAWKKADWSLVKGSYIDVPYFGGHVRQMPVVRLKNKHTGQEAYFINVHNPADTAQHHQQEKYRDEATRREIALINKLTKETGLPVFFVGDMNEHEEAYQQVTKGAPMTAASVATGTKPEKTGIDWIFGSKGVQFSHYVKDRGPDVQKATDHPIVVADATIGK